MNDLAPEPAHALLSASSAERWLACTPSARIEEALSDEDSAYAHEGSVAHALGELHLLHATGQIDQAEYDASVSETFTQNEEITSAWTHIEQDAIDTYTGYVLKRAHELEAHISIEKRVDYSKYAQGGFGTSDAVLVSTKQGVIEAIDLKFGKGVAVHAEGNPQAKLYALGAYLGLKPEVQRLIRTVRWAIVQPRMDCITEDSCSIEELLEWAETVVKPAAELAWAGKGELTPTPKGCQFCKARATCRARVAQSVQTAMDDFRSTEKVSIDLANYLLDAGEVARILPKIDAWMSWASAFKNAALVAVRDKGETIDGYKLVRGRSMRKWKTNDGELAALLKEFGLTDAAIYEAPDVRSVAQLEKEVGKSAFKPIAEALVVTPLGTPALVPDSDPRPAMSAANDALLDFKLPLNRSAGDAA